MEQTTRIELANQSDLILVRAGVMKSEEVRRLTVEDALVDTGATGLCLPTPLIEQLGLTPLQTGSSRTRQRYGRTRRLFRGGIYRPGTKRLHPSNRPS